ncbi:DNA repair protein XRCC1 [Plodia interpunctella]|uniref:DNA repair protein XRCC1 n=1 Tax=Plodia interpunctella TaxID=58824 RepID=UPI0023675945|nr:DNA repair protein XRCC1 [Plodia interpunctella]
MPRVKIDYIVSFSSEDPEHPASNLLVWEVGKRRWLCPAGESSCSVVLQLSHAVQISAIHIGTYHAAVVEVLIGRSEAPDAYEVLVPSSIFLSPLESRKEPQDKVRSFSGEQLSSTQRGDRVRVVCRQPYNKQCKYGLSFIHIFEPENCSSSAPPPKVVASPVPIQASRAIAASTNFGNSSSDEEDYRPGQLFAAAKNSAGTNSDTGSQIRKATSQILKNISDTSTKIVKSPIVKNTSSSSKQNSTEPSSNRHRNSLMYTDDEEQPHSKIDSVVQKRNDEKAKEKDAREAKDKQLKDKKEKENTKQLERDDNKGNRRDERARKDNRASSSDLNTSQHRAKKNTHNASNRDDKYDSSKRNDNNLGHRNKDNANRDDKSKNNQDRHKNTHNDSSVRPGTSNDNDSRNRDKTTFNRHRDNRDQDRKAVKRARSDDNGLRAGPISSTPHTLLSNCALVLSGYIHPQRGRIRAAAAALGATVLPDWGPRATHLICAFPNTPKLRQALASDPTTPAATGEWVEKCCELRRRLPWQWFAAEPARRLPAPDLSALSAGDDTTPRDEDGDTDDEIEKVLREQKKRRRSDTPETHVDNTNNTKSQDDSTGDVEFVRDERIKGRLTVHDSDSDGDRTVDVSDDDERKEATQTKTESDADVTDPRPPNSSPQQKHSALPNFFDGYTFNIAPDVETAGLDVNLLKRYVRAYGGVLVEEWTPEDGPVDYVLCGGASAASRGRCVRADWLWACHAERRVADTDRYLIRSADS